MSEEVIPFRSVLICGMGMMGSSLSLALKDSDLFKGKVDGVVQSEKSRSFIEKHKICDSVFRLENISDFKKFPVKNYDLIVLGLPVGKILSLVEFFPDFEGLVTDMSSTRVQVRNAFSKRNDIRFIGSHPMCGSEDAGPQAARHDLFHNKLCIILSQLQERESASRADIASLETFWKGIGMKTFPMLEEEHDEVLAYLSHAPHVLSGLIALWASHSLPVIDSNKISPMPISGGGFRDMVRIAGSNKKMWTDILESNREFILQALKMYRKELDEVIHHLDSFENEHFLKWFSEARTARNFLCGINEETE